MVFWIDAIDIGSLDQGYLNVAQKLGISDGDDEKPDVELRQRVKFQLSRESERRWLLIFDNLDSLIPKFPVVSYLPQSKLGSVVFTATNSDTARMLASRNVVELRQLAPDMAQRILETHLVTPISEGKEEEVTLY